MRKLLVLALSVACGGAPSRTSTTPDGKDAKKAPPPAWDVSSEADIFGFAADERHVYWTSSTGLHRRAHGGATPAETLSASPDFAGSTQLAVGADDVFVIEVTGELVAVPKAGGEPTALDGPTNPYELIADGDGVWVTSADAVLHRVERASSENRTIALPGAPVRLAVADGQVLATISGAAHTLIRIDPATGEWTGLSSDWALGDAYALAVSGGTVLAATFDAVLAVPIKGGTATRSLSSRIQAVAADERGYVALTANALIDQARGALPRVIATSTFAASIADVPRLALGGAYAYHLSTTLRNGEVTLRGTPREGGATMFRLPADAYLTAMGATGDTVYVGLDGAGGPRLAEVTRGGVATVASAPASITAIVADGDDVAFYADYRLHKVDRASKTSAPVSDRVDNLPLALRKGIVYWATGTLIRGVRLEDSKVFTLADITRFDERVDRGTYVQAVIFAADRLYLVIPYGMLVGVARIDERRSVDMAWTRTDRGDSSLDPSLATDGAAVFAHDGYRVFRIPLGDGETTTVRDEMYAPTVALHGVGGSVLARVRDAEGGDALIQLGGEGEARKIWWASLDGGTIGFSAAGANAVFLHSYELGAILRIEPPPPLPFPEPQNDQPSASP